MRQGTNLLFSLWKITVEFLGHVVTVFILSLRMRLKILCFFSPFVYSKARTLFEKNAAPILHLSGMDVTVVKTDYEGQAKKLLELMESTDVIIVAGGDGTLHEVVTGVLRITDEATFSKIPIGFIPLGQTSSLSHTLFAESGNKVQHITDATLAIVKGETVPLDVLQIKGEKDQPVYAMTGLRWGILQRCWRQS